MLRNPWFRAGLQAWSLGLEASSVIALRTLKMATGGVAADAEGRRMVSEKIEAGLALQVLACQSASNFDPHSASSTDPRSASSFDPLERRVRAVALAPSELVGVAETRQPRVVV